MPVSAFVLVYTALLGADAAPVPKQQPPAVAPADVRRTIERALGFLQDDAVKWRKEHDCAARHHGTMTVWALSEARRRRFAVTTETLADVTKWTTGI